MNEESKEYFQEVARHLGYLSPEEQKPDPDFEDCWGPSTWAHAVSKGGATITFNEHYWEMRGPNIGDYRNGDWTRGTYFTACIVTFAICLAEIAIEERPE